MKPVVYVVTAGRLAAYCAVVPTIGVPGTYLASTADVAAPRDLCYKTSAGGYKTSAGGFVVCPQGFRPASDTNRLRQ